MLERDPCEGLATKIIHKVKVVSTRHELWGPKSRSTASHFKVSFKVIL